MLKPTSIRQSKHGVLITSRPLVDFTSRGHFYINFILLRETCRFLHIEHRATVDGSGERNSKAKC